jgi:hypothetical protein
MQVQMRDRLPGRFVAVDDQPIAIRQSELPRQFHGDDMQVPE